MHDAPSLFFFFEQKNNYHYNLRPKGPKTVIKCTNIPKNKVHD
jgi:hypothetical protein